MEVDAWSRSAFLFLPHVIRIRIKDKLTFNLHETSYILGISRKTLYRCLDEGRFPNV